jgi:hypothetical protein
VDPRSLAHFDSDAAAAWLRSPGPMPEEPFGVGQDFSLVFPGVLDGGLPGHLRFYLAERIPNPEKRRFLLNAIYVLAWHELVLLYPKRPVWAWGKSPLPENSDNILDHLNAGLETADRSGSIELARWSNAVALVLKWKKHPRYGFWCGWGWRWQWPLTSVLLP